MATAGEGTRSNWGRWGVHDERGALNLISSEAVVDAARTVRTGRVYSLALPIQREGVPILDYRGAPQRLTLMNQADPGMFSAFGAPPDVGANEDVLIMASHTITHIDALCHVHAGGHLYNGHPADSFRTHTGAQFCGIDRVGAIAARAVMLDLPGHFGVDWLDQGYTITGADLDECARRQGVEVRPGDALLIRTGYVDYYATLDGSPAPFAQAGIGFDAVDFVADHDVAVVGADNSAVEVIPFDRGVFLGVHIELLVKLGVHLIEHLRLAELAADRVYECLFVAAPLPVKGATGSPLNPVAIA